MRLEELQGLLRKEKLDGCVLEADDPNFRYFLQAELMAGKLFIPSQGKPTVFIHRLEELEHDFDIVSMEEKTEFREFLKKKKVKRMGYNAQEISASGYFRLRNLSRLQDVGERLEQLRMLKTEKELDYLRKSARISDGIFKKLTDTFDFRTEDEVKRFIKAEMALHGVEQSFEPIVASGRGASVPHYAERKKLSKGFLIVDMGVKYKGYCSDITRTFYIGTPSARDEELYGKVLDVQEECIRMCRRGVRCSDPYGRAWIVLGEKFVHGLGHGIGLRIHELPNLKSGSPELFQDSMAVTVEPGYYDGRLGIRIEDDVIVNGDKPEVITKTKKELVCF